MIWKSEKDIYIIDITREFSDSSLHRRDSSQLVLEMRFQVFSFASKMIHKFSSVRKILMSL